ncbi:MAG: AcvB/VirJ family lysyl-phosphatidylglycerol hydrolase [Dokdonella sp.]
MLATSVTFLAGIAFVWSPWSNISLEDATVLLPVTAQSVAAPPGKDDVLMIVYSGDGGWADLDQQVGKGVVAKGIPVIGINVFKYYWRERSVEESAVELDALLTKYANLWGKQRFWIAGFSFGADVLPSIIDKLGPQNRLRIAQMVLLSPTRDVNFEIEVESYMTKQGWVKDKAKALREKISPIQHFDALPPLLQLQDIPSIVCYYGSDDKDDTVCTQKGLPPSVVIHELPGDHHFNKAYPSLTKEMLQELPARVQ